MRPLLLDRARMSSSAATDVLENTLATALDDDKSTERIDSDDERIDSDDEPPPPPLALADVISPTPGLAALFGNEDAASAVLALLDARTLLWAVPRTCCGFRGLCRPGGAVWPLVCAQNGWSDPRGLGWARAAAQWARAATPIERLMTSLCRSPSVTAWEAMDERMVRRFLSGLLSMDGFAAAPTSADAALSAEGGGGAAADADGADGRAAAAAAATASGAAETMRSLRRAFRDNAAPELQIYARRCSGLAVEGGVATLGEAFRGRIFFLPVAHVATDEGLDAYIEQYLQPERASGAAMAAAAAEEGAQKDDEDDEEEDEELEPGDVISDPNANETDDVDSDDEDARHWLDDSQLPPYGPPPQPPLLEEGEAERRYVQRPAPNFVISAGETMLPLAVMIDSGQVLALALPTGARRELEGAEVGNAGLVLMRPSAPGSWSTKPAPFSWLEFLSESLECLERSAWRRETDGLLAPD